MTMSVLQRTAAVASLCVALGLGAAACAKKAPAPTPPPPPPPAAPVTPPAPPPPPPPPPSAPAPRALSEDEIFAQKSVAQLNSERPLADVYFDLDQASIRDDARGPLTANANWMKRWTNIRITIEGHCDERGTAEYNIGLGERRANAVKAYLIELGVPADRIVTVSKGKESPFCTEKNEACWQQNRRGHFLITAK
jgi:peptidoglycan-associated lipoprotein